MASSMAKAESRLPARAVDTLVVFFRPKMKQMVDVM
jgi:hypothetical protein